MREHECSGEESGFDTSQEGYFPFDVFDFIHIGDIELLLEYGSMITERTLEDFYFHVDLIQSVLQSHAPIIPENNELVTPESIDLSPPR